MAVNSAVPSEVSSISGQLDVRDGHAALVGLLMEEFDRIAESACERRSREASLAVDIAAAAAVAATDASAGSQHAAAELLMPPGDVSSALKKREDRVVADVKMLGRRLEADFAGFDAELEALEKSLKDSSRHSHSSNSKACVHGSGVANRRFSPPRTLPPVSSPRSFRQEQAHWLHTDRDSQQQGCHLSSQRELVSHSPPQHLGQEQPLHQSHERRQLARSMRQNPQYLHEVLIKREIAAVTAATSALTVIAWLAWLRVAADCRRRATVRRSVSVTIKLKRCFACEVVLHAWRAEAAAAAKRATVRRSVSIAMKLQHSFACEVVLHAWRAEAAAAAKERRATPAERLFEAWRGSSSVATAVVPDIMDTVRPDGESMEPSLCKRAALALRRGITGVVPVALATGSVATGSVAMTPSSYSTPLEHRLEEATASLQLRDPALAELVSRLGGLLLGELAAADEALRGAHALLARMKVKDGAGQRSTARDDGL